MNVKKAIKKIVAIGTGAAFMGATVLGAMAADLNDFPAPFVKDGQFNAMIVIGESAKTPDVIGAVDIATTLQYEMKEAASTSGASGSSVSVAGDSFQIKLDNNALQLGETLGSVVTSVESADLSALAGGTFVDQKYQESVDMDKGIVSWDSPNNGDYQDQEGFYLKFSSGDVMYNYVLSFDNSAKSDIDATGHLKDFEGKSIRFMGRAYTITTAVVDGATTTLTMMGGDTNDVIEEYSTKTYTVDGKDYEVEATYIGQSSAKFRINGEVTDALAEGETYKLNDGTEIGIREILENEAGEGGQDIVEFYLGANKLVLTSDGTPDDLEVGDSTFSNDQVTISFTNTSSKYYLDGLEVQVKAANDYWIASGDKLSKFIDGSDDDYLFGNFDILYGDVTDPVSSDVKLSASGDDIYTLDFTTAGGLDYSLPLWYVSTSPGNHGDRNGDLLLSGNISKDDMFVIGTTNGNPEDVEARIYRFDSYKASDRTIKIKDLSGDTTEITLSTDMNKSVRIDGEYHTFALYNYSAATGGTITVTGRKTEFGLDSGAYLTLDNNATEANVTVTVPADLKDSGSAEVESFSVGDATDKITVKSSISGDVSSFEEVKTDVYAGYSVYGMKVTKDGTGDHMEYAFNIPHAQRLPQVFAVSGDVSTSTVEGVSGSAYTIAQVGTGIAMLDTEVGSTWKNGNAIVVGGPCVNSVAAELMGNPAVCTEGFTQGNAMIKLFAQSGDNVAMLVAGYSADDTRRAANAVHKFRSYSGFKGSEVKVSGTSMSDISVTSVQ